MAGKWSPGHREFLEDEMCDVWLLTEVHPEVQISEMTPYPTVANMQHQEAWAAVFSRVPATKGSHPHRASASAQIGAVRFVSSVLPWRSCGASWPGASLAEKQALTLAELTSGHRRRDCLGRGLEPGPGGQGLRRDYGRPWNGHRPAGGRPVVGTDEVVGQCHAGASVDRPHRRADGLGCAGCMADLRGRTRTPTVRSRRLCRLHRRLKVAAVRGRAAAPRRIAGLPLADRSPMPASADGLRCD